MFIQVIPEQLSRLKRLETNFGFSKNFVQKSCDNAWKRRVCNN